MNYISFEKEKEYFKHSLILKNLQEQVHEKLSYEKDLNLLNICTQLYLESVIKHNLSPSATRVESIYLVTPENSKDVWNLFGKLNQKDKHNLSEKNRKVYDVNRMVFNNINIIVLNAYIYDNIDMMEEMKKEYFNFKKNEKKDLVKS